MSFASHNLAGPEAEPVVAPRRGAARPRWFRFARWGATGVAAFYVAACIKCILVYIVLPALAVWWAGSEVRHEPAEQPPAVSDPGHVQGVDASGDTVVGSAEDPDAGAAR